MFVLPQKGVFGTKRSQGAQHLDKEKELHMNLLAITAALLAIAVALQLHGAFAPNYSIIIYMYKLKICIAAMSKAGKRKDAGAKAACEV